MRVNTESREYADQHFSADGEAAASIFLAEKERADILFLPSSLNNRFSIEMINPNT